METGLFLDNLEFWHWLAGGMFLVALEALVPGIFIIWPGFAALIVGLVMFFVPLSSVAQLLLFAISIGGVILLWRTLFGQKLPKIENFLNRRGDACVGKICTLSQPLNNGYSRATINDGSWVVKSTTLPDGTPEGTHVRVTACEGTVLIVEKLED